MGYAALFRRNGNEGNRKFDSEEAFSEWFAKEKDVRWAVLVRVDNGHVELTCSRPVMPENRSGDANVAQ